MVQSIMYNNLQKNGFTLMELSIVLIIISLIVAGVVGGRSLIRSAELRAVINDFTKYQTSINAFIDKYDYYPGDLPNAKEYWPDDSVYSGFTTGNGNGNGSIGNLGEHVFAWEHLSSAKMIEGNYTGGGIGQLEPGKNVPKGSMPNSGFDLRYKNLGTTYWHGQNGTVLVFGARRVSEINTRVLKPSEARSIDTKMDDGLPHKGKMYAKTGGGVPVGCMSNEWTKGAEKEYIVSYSDLRCYIFIWLSRGR